MCGEGGVCGIGSGDGGDGGICCAKSYEGCIYMYTSKPQLLN